MIKWLQGAVVLMFVLMCVAGVMVFIFAMEKLSAYGQLIGILFPVFLSSVIPALIGSPLTDYVRSAGIAKETKAQAVAQAANPTQGLTG